MTVYLYDNSWEGFLTGVFSCFENKGESSLRSAARSEAPGLFDTALLQPSEQKAARVEAGMVRLGREVPPTVYKAWLSERGGIEDDIIASLRLGFSEKRDPFPSREVDAVRRTAHAARAVGWEAHRLLGLMRLTHIHGDLYGADYGHDYNLLPLIGEHFHTRFHDQRLIIRDPKRRIAILSGPDGWEITSLPDGPLPPLPEPGDIEALWKGYFKTIANQDRINYNLQRHFVPKKYRQYILEFKG